jgi:tight adherence protein B
LTAEGRFSAVILSLMPFFFVLLFQLMQPKYIPLLFHNAMGIAALVFAGLGNVVGWVWLRKIVHVEV